jgi:hypothetical protein
VTRRDFFAQAMGETGTTLIADPPEPEKTDVAAAFERLDRWGSERAWRGSDPYDGLNAKRGVSLLKRTVLGRRLLTQAVKRSPLDLRPALGIEPARSGAAMALLASAYAIQAALPEAESRIKLEQAIDWLLEQRLSSYDEPSWGYHFDVQTRVFFYPASSPNTIATAFAGFALLDGYERTGRLDLLDLASATARFFVEHVPQTDAPKGAFFGYLVGDRTQIHNANMLVAALLARVARVTGSADLRERAQSAVDYTVALQRADGSWPYGEQAGLGWVDNFHTAYVLMCLEVCRRSGLASCEEALASGLRHYARDFFLADGTPRYYTHSTYPVDGQCSAEAIRLFALASSFDGSYLAHAARAFDYAQRELRRGDGAYIFQRGRHWTNKATHIRWVEAPFLVALATLSKALST